MYNAAPSFPAPAAAVGAVCGCHAVITSNTEQHTKVGDCMREDDTMGKVSFQQHSGKIDDHGTALHKYRNSERETHVYSAKENLQFNNFGK
jgi:hypothetical protein